jgi:hypothetical protein
MDPADVRDIDSPRHARKEIPAAVLSQLESIVRPEAGGMALDVGAGNCRLTQCLDLWGFAAFALDSNTAEDGLKAGQTYIDQGARFVRIRCALDRLPIADSTVSLLVANASAQASDFPRLLTEFRRVLEPEGRIVIMQTPFVASVSNGGRNPEPTGYLTREILDQSSRSLDLEYRMIFEPKGFRQACETLMKTLLGRRVAEFPIVVLQSTRGLNDGTYL